MSRNSFLSFAAFTVAVSMSLFFTACSPATSCSAATCAGCCDAMGLCQAGTTSSACGERGAMCASCAATSSCGAGRCSLVGVGGGVSAAGGTSAGGVAGGGSSGGGNAGGGNAGGGSSGGGNTGASACDRAASLIQSECGASAPTVLSQCQQLVASSCSSSATAWFDCLISAPTSVTCVAGDFGSTTACVSQFQTMRTCLGGAGGGGAGGGSAGGTSGGNQLNQPCPNTAPLCVGTNLYCALNVTADGTSDGVFASTGACRKTCSTEADCGASQDCCMLRNASATVCLPSTTGICDRPASVCKANGQSCVNNTNCCSGKCSVLFSRCEAP